jgi:hypothetical protein
MPVTAAPSRSTARPPVPAVLPPRIGLRLHARRLLERALRWFLTLTGGALLGAGLVLHGQVALARMMSGEVERTFVLWRAIGKATVFLQGSDVRMALAMSEVPPEVLRESDFAAWTLIGAGVGLAAAALLLPRRKLLL